MRITVAPDGFNSVSDWLSESLQMHWDSCICTDAKDCRSWKSRIKVDVLAVEVHIHILELGALITYWMSRGSQPSPTRKVGKRMPIFVSPQVLGTVANSTKPVQLLRCRNQEIICSASSSIG